MIRVVHTAANLSIEGAHVGKGGRGSVVFLWIDRSAPFLCAAPSAAGLVAVASAINIDRSLKNEVSNGVLVLPRSGRMDIKITGNSIHKEP